MKRIDRLHSMDARQTAELMFECGIKYVDAIDRVITNINRKAIKELMEGSAE